MQHPEIFLIPLLMLADYFLTLVGAKMAEEKYRLHYKITNYELNPFWQKSVNERRWLNPRHLILVTLITILLLLGEYQGGELRDMVPYVVAALVGAWGAVVGGLDCTPFPIPVVQGSFSNWLAVHW